MSAVLEIYNCLQQITKVLSEDADGAGMLSNIFSTLWTNSAQWGLETKWDLALDKEKFNPWCCCVAFQIPFLEDGGNEIISPTFMVSENNLGSCEGILKHNREMFPAFTQVF